MLTKHCVHDKTKRWCRICTPTAFCKHNKQKRTCRACGSNAFCIHNRRKNTCSPCGGKSRCKHDILKSHCKICGGNAYCLHDKQKNLCKACNGKSICLHNRVRSKCKDCNGGSICLHNRIRDKCKLCCSSLNLCVHNNFKRRCLPCGGALFCIHGKRKNRCYQCGTGICVHNKVKEGCKECGSSKYCIHNKEKSCCKLCGGSQLCIMPFCEIRKNQYAYKPYCFRCFVFMNPDSPLVRNFKTKEICVCDFILIKFPGLSWIHNKKIPDGCSLRRADLSLDLGSHMIFIEIDENAHYNYTCETKRICELWNDVGQRPSVFIRFNPDKYIDETNAKIPSCWTKNTQGFSKIKNQRDWDNRLLTLEKTISENIVTIPTKSITISQLFFTDKSCSTM